jgi:hypothetical protein|tara:strand:+ start:268 stop:549 length:282 start_codon:yes stop_codon:yes gene_type:complete
MTKKKHKIETTKNFNLRYETNLSPVNLSPEDIRHLIEIYNYGIKDEWKWYNENDKPQDCIYHSYKKLGWILSNLSYVKNSKIEIVKYEDWDNE